MTMQRRIEATKERLAKKKFTNAVRREYAVFGNDLKIEMYEKPEENYIIEYNFDYAVCHDWMNSHMPEGSVVDFCRKEFIVPTGLFRYIGYVENSDGLIEVLKTDGFVCTN